MGLVTKYWILGIGLQAMWAIRVDNVGIRSPPHYAGIFETDRHGAGILKKQTSELEVQNATGYDYACPLSGISISAQTEFIYLQMSAMRKRNGDFLR